MKRGADAAAAILHPGTLIVSCIFVDEETWRAAEAEAAVTNAREAEVKQAQHWCG